MQVRMRRCYVAMHLDGTAGTWLWPVLRAGAAWPHAPFLPQCKALDRSFFDQHCLRWRLLLSSVLAGGQRLAGIGCNRCVELLIPQARSASRCT